MFDPLTKKQKQVLDFISDFIKEFGYSPSLDETRIGLKLKAVSTVHEHINKLKEKGYLTKEINQARGVDIRSKSDQVGNIVRVPLIGIVKKSILLLSNKPSFILYDKSLLTNSENLSIVKVEDSSLSKEGFIKGDIIVIQKDANKKNLCLVSTNSSNLIVIRKVIEEKFSVKLISPNPEVKERVYKRVEVIGSIVSLIRNFAS